MRQSQALRFISLPIAAGLSVALVVACTNDSPTAPAKFSPSAPALTYTYAEEVDGVCPKGGYKLQTVTPGTLGDTDNDGSVCRKGSDGGSKKNPPKK